MQFFSNAGQDSAFDLLQAELKLWLQAGHNLPDLLAIFSAEVPTDAANPDKIQLSSNS